MISKNQFIEFISQYQKFLSDIDKIVKFLHIDDCYTFENGIASHIGYMFDIFIASNLTEEGADLVNSFIYDEQPLVIYTEEETLFGKESSTIEINNLEGLYNYLFKNEYFL